MTRLKMSKPGAPISSFSSPVSDAVQSYLYGLNPADPITLIAVTAALLAVAAVAGLLPALRASRINPLAALRHE
jgi:ABC-type lipoprotein release transport system permease subunit